jgi:uncharacterized metal-binding protein (TIGR02443 family)
VPRRFIAGAVCPECGLRDKIVVDSVAGLRECVNCGFSDDRPVGGGAEPKTRVNRPAARRVDTPAEKITLIPAVSSGKSRAKGRESGDQEE